MRQILPIEKIAEGETVIGDDGREWEVASKQRVRGNRAYDWRVWLCALDNDEMEEHRLYTGDEFTVER